jgi:Fe-S-cluster-containing hydrogenase component 2
MIRKIVHIDEDKCNGCGLCAQACHEAAIKMIDGKARLVKDDYCDGLGDCLPHCPADAIKIIEREAAAYDEAAVKVRQSLAQADEPVQQSACPRSRAHLLDHARMPEESLGQQLGNGGQSTLRSWPIQIKLAPVRAPYLDGARLLIAADCTAYAYARFHENFLRNRIALIGCPKLDGVDYTEKLTEILKANDIKSVKVVRMEVPCCGGIEYAVRRALQDSGKMLPWQVVTISCDGRILEE